MDKVITQKVIDTINEILRRGNDVKIRRHKTGVVVIEEKQTIKYRAN